jgi:hypothetical protein
VLFDEFWLSIKLRLGGYFITAFTQNTPFSKITNFSATMIAMQI